MTRAPAAMTSFTWLPSWAKSADRIEGATPRSASSWRLRSSARASATLHRPEHAALAVIAGHDRRAGHAHDRRVLPTVGTYRHELVPVQAVHAAVAPRN